MVESSELKEIVVAEGIMNGVVAAGDGIAFKIQERKQSEILNESPSLVHILSAKVTML